MFPRTFKFRPIPRLTQSAVFWSYVATSLRTGSALVLLPVILFYLDERELAFWYVLIAVGQMAYQLDFGFSQSLTRSAAYLWAGAPELQSRGLVRAASSSGKPNLSLMGDLIATFRLFYFMLAGGLVLTSLLIGWPFIQRVAQPGDVEFWYYAGAWLVYAIAAGIHFAGLLWAAFLNGINQVHKSQQLFVLGLVINYAVIFAGLWYGIGVWSLVLGYLAMSLVVRGFGLWIVRRKLRAAGWQGEGRMNTALVKTLWGNSWRTGAFSAGAVMTREGPVYLCGVFFPAPVTASLGITMHMIRLVRQLSMVWVRVKIPWIQQKWVTHEIPLMLKVFHQRVAIGVVAYVLGAAGIVFLGPLLLVHARSDAVMLSGIPLALLLVFYLIDNVRSYFAQLVVSANIVPFWRSWLCTGGLAMLAGAAMARYTSLTAFLWTWLILHALWVFWHPVVQAMRLIRQHQTAASDH